MKRLIVGLLILSSVVFLSACSGKTDYSNLFDGIILPEETTDKITLPTHSIKHEGIRIYWNSSDSNVINYQGTVVRQNETRDIELEVYAILDFQRYSKKFTVKVIGFDTKTLELSAYQSDYGFASSVISSRHALEADKISVVHNEIEFLDALNDKKIKVIKIESDLNMGSLNVERLLRAAGKTQTQIDEYMSGSVYRANNNTPISHPTLLEEGVGQVIIQNRMGDQKGLMIYSEKGITIKHLTTQIKDAEDIVIRNIHFTGIWEWDDDLAANYDLNDWDYFTVERTKGLWLDHLTLDQSYDGLVDVKSGTANFTLSYFKLDFQHNEFIQAQIDKLEEEYQTYLRDYAQEYSLEELKEKRATTSRYAKLRLTMSMEDIATYASFQKKGFNFGNTTQGLGFDTITITMHDFLIRNLQDRLPRLRQGDVHLYNIYLDATDIVDYKSMLTDAGDKLINQAMVPTEQGAVLLENSKFVNVLEPIKNHQDSTITRAFSGKFQVKNSVLYNQGTYYKGDSTEFGTLWKRSNTNIQWELEFYFRNHQELPYQYEDQLLDPDLIYNTLSSNHVGAGEISGLEWLRIRSILSEKTDITPYHRLDEDRVQVPNVLVDLNDTDQAINASNGQIINFPYYPVIQNFYGGMILIKDVDYKVTVDDDQLDLTKPGSYKVVYTIESLVNTWDMFTLTQEVVVYDGADTNEVYAYEVTDEFDAKITIDLKTYGNVGTLYYLVSDDEYVTIDDLLALGDQYVLDNVQTQLTDIPTQRAKYLYMFIRKDDKDSKMIKKVIVSETIVKIYTISDFNRMLSDGVTSKNKYYILENDLDFTGSEIPELTTAHRFMGVFDGNNHTIKNLVQTKTRGGIFFTIENGYIKNLVLDQIHLEVKERSIIPDEEFPDVTQIVKPQDDAGLLATYIYVWGKIENVVIKDSSLKSDKNYVGSFVGRVRTGVAYFENLSIINTQLEQTTTTDAKYLGGFIGGAEANTTLHMTNLYANGLKMKQRIENEMVGGILGRARSLTYISQVVLLNIEIESRHNIGLIAGKEEATVKAANIKDIFIEASVNVLTEGATSQYVGYIYGNPDARYQGTGITTVTNAYAIPIAGLNISQSKGNNDVTIIGEQTAVDATWWQDKLPNIAESSLWEIIDNQARLKNSIQ